MQNAIEITIFTGSGEPVLLTDVPFVFNEGKKSFYTGADNSGAVIIRAGWLGIQVNEFPQWHQAHSIHVTYANGRDSETAFEVKRNFNDPESKDGWLWYPVLPRFVMSYTAND